VRGWASPIMFQGMREWSKSSRSGRRERENDGSWGGDRKSNAPPCRRKRDKDGAPSVWWCRSSKAKSKSKVKSKVKVKVKSPTLNVAKCATFKDGAPSGAPSRCEQQQEQRQQQQQRQQRRTRVSAPHEQKQSFGDEGGLADHLYYFAAYGERGGGGGGGDVQDVEEAAAGEEPEVID